MGETSQLQRMGRELKCPICLSLLNSAVSLTCNHVFCNSCIEKSMKSSSGCPVCKIPFRRREVRPAPHMDNLVSIYKSMEVASGVNILVSQALPSTKVSGGENQHEGNEVCGRKKRGTFGETPNQENWIIRSKGKESKGSKKKVETSNLNPTVRPSFPTKKRVQVTEYPPPETPTQPAKSDSGMVEIAKDRLLKSSVILEDNPSLNEKGETVFSPFFWLREEEDVENPSQQTDGDLVIETPPDAPCFSDIKEPDDEATCEMTPEGTCMGPNDADIYDSELFEWTQRACSPEVIWSPMKVQVEATDESGKVTKKVCKSASQGTDTNEESGTGNSKNMILEKGKDNMEASLPTLSSPRCKSAEKSNKRPRKESESTFKKRAKKTKGEVTGSNIDFQKVNEDNIQGKKCEKKGNPLNLGKTRKRSKKVGFDTSAIGSLEENSLGCAGAKLLIQGKEGCEGTCNLKKSSKRNKKIISQERRDRIRSKIQKLNTAKNATQSRSNDGLTSQPPNKCSTIGDDKEVPELERKSRKSEVKSITTPKFHKNRKCLKKVKFSVDSVSKDNLADDIQGIQERVDAKETQPPENTKGKFNVRNVDDLSKMKKASSVLNRVLLRKCETIPTKIQCSFCQSAEDSKVLGVMVHYFKGQPVTANYNGGSNIIHAHKNCTEWAPNVYFKDDNAINLEAELARSRRITCCCCGMKGAALGCYEKTCRKSFHVPCAKLTPECRWDNDNFVMLCPLHASLKLPNKTSVSQIKQEKKSIPKRHSHIPPTQVTIKHNNSASQQWNSQRSSEKLVICYSTLTDVEKETISEFERLSGFSVLKNWDSSVTHVIASTDENRACRRTLKFLMGVLEGKWILSIDWVKACIKALELVDEQNYEIEVDIHGIRDGPRLGRLRLSNKQLKLFNGCKFYFTGDFLPSYKGYLHDLVVAAGGTVLHRKPVSGGQEDLSSGCTKSQTFVIYSLELQDKYGPSKRNVILNRRRSDAELLACSTGAIAASNSWILNSIAGCKLQNLAE